MVRVKSAGMLGVLVVCAVVVAGVVVRAQGTNRAATATRMTVYKSPTCGCCALWVEHVRQAGFTVDVVENNDNDLAKRRAALGVSEALSSCHTAQVGGYVVEGHVPAQDIKRLLAERPTATGLTAPGMPMGSPGMEQGGMKQPYDVLLFQKSGSSKVFAKH